MLASPTGVNGVAYEYDKDRNAENAAERKQPEVVRHDSFRQTRGIGIL